MTFIWSCTLGVTCHPALSDAKSFSEFSHRVQDQLNAIPPEVRRHPAHSLDLYAGDFYIFKQLRRARKCHTFI